MSTELWTFIIIGTVGLVFLIVTTIFGEIFDFLEDFDFGPLDEILHLGDTSGPSLFSTRVLSAFVLGFGYIGALCLLKGFSAMTSSLIGAGSGIVCGGLILKLMQWITRQGQTSSISIDKLAGMTALVTLPIAKNEIGEVTCQYATERFKLGARSADNQPIEANTTVVIKVVSGNIAIVERL